MNAPRRSCRLVFVSRLPAPYREPLLQKVSALPGVDLTVLYEFEGRSGTAWKAGETGLAAFTYARRTCRPVLRGGMAGRVDAVHAIRWSGRMLDDLQPDLVVVHGYSFPLAWGAIRWLRRTRVPYALRSDTNARIERTGGWKRGLKRRFVGGLVRDAQSILHIGTANREYWTGYGARPEQFAEARYAVDQSLFRPAMDDGAARRAFRAQHGLGDGPVFLYVGRFIPRKNLPLLLDAFRSAATTNPDLALVIAGDGPDRAVLQQRISAGGPGRIVDLGLTPYAQLPAVYQACDVLVCPYEREPWGLTLNEAMCCGLPVIAAGNGTCGAAIDLVTTGETGVALPSLTRDLMAEAIVRLASDSAELGRLKAGALARMKQWSFDETVKGFAEAARRALAGGTH